MKTYHLHKLGSNDPIALHCSQQSSGLVELTPPYVLKPVDRSAPVRTNLLSTLLMMLFAEHMSMFVVARGGMMFTVCVVGLKTVVEIFSIDVDMNVLVSMVSVTVIETCGGAT